MSENKCVYGIVKPYFCTPEIHFDEHTSKMDYEKCVPCLLSGILAKLSKEKEVIKNG